MKTVMAPHTPTLPMVNTGAVMKNDRRASKPLMEKRRRERINKSLNELKSILLNALRKDQSTCHSKLEKADILEMTVRYLRTIQRQRVTAAMAMDPAAMGNYRGGYQECKSEVAQFIDGTSENVHPEVKARLMSHLGSNMPIHQGNPLPPHLLPHGPLLTTTPPVQAGPAPLQIRMAPNPHIQHAMVAAAAAMNRSMLQQQQQQQQQQAQQQQQQQQAHLMESATSPTSSHSGKSPRPRHVRHNSGSSFTSSGFPSSPLSLSPSPKKPLDDRQLQGGFMLPATSSHQPLDVAPCSPDMSDDCSAASDDGSEGSEVWRPW